jgi:hypothetical protein
MSGTNGNDEFMDRDFQPGEFDLVERQLRRELRSEALRIEPHERLEAILSGARSGARSGDRAGTAHGRPPTRSVWGWLTPLAAAAAVAVAAGTLWVATRDSGQPVPPAGPSPTSSVPMTTTTPSRSASPTSSGSPSSTAPIGTTLALPAYFVRRTGDDGGFGLYREFVRMSIPSSDREAKALAAVRLAMNPSRLGDTGYLRPWSSTRADAVSVTSSRITVTLSGPGASGFPDEVERLAVQELVWTAQAAVGKGTIPVTFRLTDGSTALFGRFPAGNLYNRPPTQEYYRDLAPIWITSPTRGQVIGARSAIRVTGEASVFEATLQWSLVRGTASVGKGTVMATAGAPSRGTWSVDLPPLDPGTYTVSAWWNSPKDGSELDRTAVTFTVR